ncbi:hypothetical protein L596_000277 [Steinernema carpocapsae]|uniref:Uncharacterized protein n=1 Tax=Steinernema carpocapsae TaxID=34508 RepID=A0A4V6I6X3_STECR|nr:hypothetical protein L596_000277 [Steinernema carpocapsae]
MLWSALILINTTDIKTYSVCTSSPEEQFWKLHKHGEHIVNSQGSTGFDMIYSPFPYALLYTAFTYAVAFPLTLNSEARFLPVSNQF